MTNRVKRELKQMKERGAGVLIRDLVIFNVKTLLDAAKDLVLFHVATGAAIIDLLLTRGRRPRFFYAVLSVGERLDLWLNLYGASEGAAESDDGLFGTSRAGSDTILGRIEEIMRGREEEPPSGRGTAPDGAGHGGAAAVPRPAAGAPPAAGVPRQGRGAREPAAARGAPFGRVPPSAGLAATAAQFGLEGSGSAPGTDAAPR